MSRRYNKPEMMKPMNPFVESYRREIDIVMPKKEDNKIKPDEIFEGLSKGSVPLNQKKIKPKKNEKKTTTKKNKSKK